MADETTTTGGGETDARAASDRAGRPWLAVALVLYAALTVPFIGRMGAGFDEVTDLQIADSYHRDWLVGDSEDPSQMRLPMVVTALVAWGDGRGSLMISRGVSVVVGALAILGIFLYGRREFGVAGGAIAAFGFAASPFILPYARMALTESNIFEACGFAWFLYLAASYRWTGKTGWLFTAGVAAGLTTASKFTGVIAVPGLLGVVALVAWRGAKPDMADGDRRDGWLFATVLFGVIAVPHIVAVVAGGVGFYAHRLPWSAKLAHYGAVFLVSLVVGEWAVSRREFRPGFALSVVLALAGACVGFFVFAPPHVANPAILSSIVERFLISSSGHPFDRRVGNMAFYGLAWLFKSGPLVGALCFVAPVVWLFLRKRLDHAATYVVLALSLVSLWTIDSSQPFYLFVPFVGALGLAAGLVAALLRRYRVAGIVLLALLVAQLGADLWMSFPDFNLNGYQYLGERWVMGRPTVGYNGVATLPPDGLEQCLRRVAKRGEDTTVWVYAAWTPKKVVRWVLDGTGVEFTMGTTVADPHGPEGADYVVLTREIETIAKVYGLAALPDGWHMVDRAWLGERFEKVTEVKRAFGLEVASLWRRKGLRD